MIAKAIKKIAAIENSNPSQGKKVMNADPRPKIEINPIPQAAQPGTRAAKKMAIPERKPFLDLSNFIFKEDLQTIRDSKIPKRIEIIIIVKKDIRDTEDLKPIARFKNSCNVPREPRVEKLFFRFEKFKIKTFSEQKRIEDIKNTRIDLGFEKTCFHVLIKLFIFIFFVI